MTLSLSLLGGSQRGSRRSMFTQLLLMTTSLKPRPKYKRRTTTEKTMTEQTTPSPQTLTKVQSHLPDVQLIDRNALWDDFKNRMKINNFL